MATNPLQTAARSSRRLIGILSASAIALTVAALVAPARALAAADPAKVLHWYFPTAETGFDPARVSDLYSATIDEAIFERLLTYDYMARPAKVVPMVAEAMPEVTDEGRTYTFHLRKGIYFTPDQAFKGAKRELTANDFVYSYMRFVDPRNRSAYAFLVAGKFVGLDALVAKAEKTNHFDYDAKIPGIEAVDRYTLRFRLTERDYNFPFIVAHTSMGAVAREVIDAYGDDSMSHPVGTGPYFLSSWTRRAKIVLDANPDYRGFVWDFASGVGDSEQDRKIAADMKGKQLPRIGRVEISVIEESQAVWLAFEGKQLDYINVPVPFAKRALDGAKLLPLLAAQGINLDRSVDPDILFTFFNMKDPVVGGFSKEKMALRRAIAMAYDNRQEIQIVRNGQAIPLQMPIPPGVVGYNANYRSIIQYDPDTANKLLDYFGYKKGSDGWRSLPDGSPLIIHQATETSGIGREVNELWDKNMRAIGIHMVFDVSKFDENRKAAKVCKLQMWGSSWIADYPDGDNFMQNFYGPNIGQSNNGCYASPAFDKYYAQQKAMPDSPERNRIFLYMSRQMEIDTPQVLHEARLRNELIRPWVMGFKKHPVLQADFVYLDIDKAAGQPGGK